MLKKAVASASRFVIRRGGPIPRNLHILADIYVRAYKNFNYDMRTNGEHFLLDQLAGLDMRTVLDVGANAGSYAEACLSRFPHATVHAFEIAPAIFQKLQAKLAGSGRLVLNGFGLSDHDGQIELNYSPGQDTLSSMIGAITTIHDVGWQQCTAEIRTGDGYLRDSGIETVDLLKIDVEGAEHLVLQGFAGALQAGRIAAIQFEFGMINIYTKFLLIDFWSLLQGYGFALGPIMPNGVAFMDYDPRAEDFQGPPNFFAVHASRPDMIQAVRRT